MERWISFVVIAIICLACEEDKCFKSAGDNINFYIEASSFNEIEVHNTIAIELIDHPDTVIEVFTKENLKPHLSFTIENNVLVMKDNNACNWLREYGNTKVVIKHPNIKRIAHLGNDLIYSTDTLTYPELSLYTKNTTGNFRLIISNNKVNISINDLNNLYLSGKTNEFQAGIYAGDGRIEASELIAQKVNIFHRGTNDMIIYPETSLMGKIIGFGDVILYKEPLKIEIEDTGAGEIIMK